MRFRGDPASMRGSIAPVVTPFADDGQLDTEGLRRLINWQLDSGSHGISLGGWTGEPSAQTLQERIAAMTEAARVIADRVPFLPGTGSARLDETLQLTAAASELGADAALVITPYYARRPRRACSSGTRRWPARTRTCPSSSTTSRPAPPSTSHRRPSPGCGDGSATSSG